MGGPRDEVAFVFVFAFHHYQSENNDGNVFRFQYCSVQAVQSTEARYLLDTDTLRSQGRRWVGGHGVKAIRIVTHKIILPG